MSNYPYLHYVDAHKAYQSFNSRTAMMESVRLFWHEHCFVLPETCKTVLEYLARCSKHVYGVCWMMKETIADELQLSRSTVWRALKQLISHGAIEKHYEKHKKGGRRSCLVIQPYTSQPRNEALTCESDVSDDVGFEHLATLIDTLDETLPTAPKMPAKPYTASDCSIASEPRNKISNLALNKLPLCSTQNVSVTEINVTLPRTDYPQAQFSKFNSIKKSLAIPDYFHQAIDTYVDSETLYQIWNRTDICHKSVGAKFIFTDIVSDAWNMTFKMMKQGKMENDDSFGLYYGILRNKLDEFKAYTAQHGGYSERFKDKQPQQYISRYADHERFITKRMRKVAKNIMERCGITFQEALLRV